MKSVQNKIVYKKVLLKTTDKFLWVSWNSKDLEFGFIFMLNEFNFIL